MLDALYGFLFGLCVVGLIFTGRMVERKVIQDKFSCGDLKVYSWSSVEQLNAELAKGYEIEKTYNVTNMILRKVTK